MVTMPEPSARGADIMGNDPLAVGEVDDGVESDAEFASLGTSADAIVSFGDDAVG